MTVENREQVNMLITIIAACDMHQFFAFVVISHLLALYINHALPAPTRVPAEVRLINNVSYSPGSSLQKISAGYDVHHFV
jgi:hypothetical protein